ncbi:MAG: site-specific integrase [Planctomycetota bacterium]
MNVSGAGLSWDDYWIEVDDKHLSKLSRNHRATCKTMHRRLKEAAVARGKPRLFCTDVNALMVLDVETSMRSTGVEESTIKSNMATLWSIISWGQDYDMIPDFRRPRKRKGKREKQIRNTKAKGRSLSFEEIERMEAAIPLVIKRGEQPEAFVNALHAMRLIGLRLSECYLFCWEPLDGVHYPMRLERDTAAIQFADVQKSGIESEVPLTNEAIEWLRKLSKEEPWPFRTFGPKGQHKTHDRLGRVLSAAGRRARIVVKRWSKPDGEKVKYASAHDLRRTFATNLQRDLTISERQRLTRHADASTLLDHYSDAPTPVLVAKLRGVTKNGG